MKIRLIRLDAALSIYSLVIAVSVAVLGRVNGWAESLYIPSALACLVVALWIAPRRTPQRIEDV